MIQGAIEWNFRYAEKVIHQSKVEKEDETQGLDRYKKSEREKEILSDNEWEREKEILSEKERERDFEWEREGRDGLNDGANQNRDDRWAIEIGRN